MNSITPSTTQAHIIPAQSEQVQAITAELVNSFVRYLDRTPATTKTYLNNLSRFLEYLAAEGITQPTRDDVIAYRDELLARGYKANTIAGYLRSVKQFFSWLAACGLYPNVSVNIHTPHIDRRSLKKDALAAEEVAQIEAAIHAEEAAKRATITETTKDAAGRTARSNEKEKRLNAMYLLAVTAGLRCIELHRANVGDLECKGEQAYLYVFGKGRSEADQRTPIAREVYAAIVDYLATREAPAVASAPLFCATGNRNKGGRIAANTISGMLKNAMKAAGYDSPRLTAHSLRHTAGTLAQEVTGDLYMTQRYMRHADPATTEVYLHNDYTTQQAATAQAIFDACHSAAEGDDEADQLKAQIAVSSFVGGACTWRKAA